MYILKSTHIKYIKRKLKTKIKLYNDNTDQPPATRVLI